MSSGRWVSSWPAWVLLAVGLAVVLVFSVSTGNGPLSASQRAAAIDSVLKCPSCDGISVEDSSASTAAAVRQVVLTRVLEGQSDQQIERYLESRYGPSILLRPPTTGLTAVVWLLPLLAGAAGIGGMGVFFWRRRRPPETVVTPEDRALVERALTERGSDAVGGTASPGR